MPDTLYVTSIAIIFLTLIFIIQPTYSNLAEISIYSNINFLCSNFFSKLFEIDNFIVKQ